VVQWCGALIDDGTMAATSAEIEALAHNAMLVAAYWPSYDRVRNADREKPPVPDAGRAAYQVMTLFGPYLAQQARAHLDRLAASYL